MREFPIVVGGPANHVRKKGKKLGELVLQCAEDVKIEIEEIEIPPAQCGSLRWLDQQAGP